MSDFMDRFREGLEEEVWHTSPLGKFMRDQRAKMEEVLAAAEGDWAWVARALAMSSLTDHTGQDPTEEIARETWRRVEERRREGPMPWKGRP